MKTLEELLRETQAENLEMARLLIDALYVIRCSRCNETPAVKVPELLEKIQILLDKRLF